MAGDWIPVRLDLFDDAAVVSLCRLCSSDNFAVVGRLVRLWGWASSQSLDGSIPRMTHQDIDRVVQRRGFAAALVKVGWLEVDDSGAHIPNFDRWLGNSAKRRLDAARRQKESRSNRGHAPPEHVTTMSQEVVTPSPVLSSAESSDGIGGLGEREGGELSPGWLARKWVHGYRGSGRSEKDIRDVSAQFAEWIDAGLVTAQKLSEALDAKRDRSKFLWQFKVDLLGSAKSATDVMMENYRKARARKEAECKDTTPGSSGMRGRSR